MLGGDVPWEGSSRRSVSLQASWHVKSTCVLGAKAQPSCVRGRLQRSAPFPDLMRDPSPHFAIFHRSLSLCDMGGRPRRWVSCCPLRPWSPLSSSVPAVRPPLNLFPSFRRRNLSCASLITVSAWE